jgi:hypothetical protein
MGLHSILKMNDLVSHKMKDIWNINHQVNNCLLKSLYGKLEMFGDSWRVLSVGLSKWIITKHHQLGNNKVRDLIWQGMIDYTRIKGSWTLNLINKAPNVIGGKVRVPSLQSIPSSCVPSPFCNEAYLP